MKVLIRTPKIGREHFAVATDPFYKSDSAVLLFQKSVVAWYHLEALKFTEQ